MNSSQVQYESNIEYCRMETHAVYYSKGVG